jgi:hypothetical protein
MKAAFGKHGNGGIGDATALFALPGLRLAQGMLAR